MTHETCDLRRRLLPVVSWPPQCRGFSLLELLIVVALIFIVFVMVYGPNSRGLLEKRKGACEKNLQSIYVALKTYSLDYNNLFPAAGSAQTSEEPLSVLVPRYTTGTEVFICPGTNDKSLPEAQPFANRTISYAYYMGHTINDGADQPLVSDRQVNTLSKTLGQQVFSPDGKGPGNNHKQEGGNVLFCDGSIQTSPPKAAFPLVLAPNVVLLNPKP